MHTDHCELIAVWLKYCVVTKVNIKSKSAQIQINSLANEAKSRQCSCVLPPLLFRKNRHVPTFIVVFSVSSMFYSIALLHWISCASGFNVSGLVGWLQCNGVLSYHTHFSDWRILHLATFVQLFQPQFIRWCIRKFTRVYLYEGFWWHCHNTYLKYYFQYGTVEINHHSFTGVRLCAGF